MPKVGIKLLKLSHARICSHPKILFLVPLLFVASIPTYFLNFLIILVCLLFIHASIHSNLSAGAQNITGAYVIMLVYRRLLTTRLHGKAAV